MIRSMIGRQFLLAAFFIAVTYGISGVGVAAEDAKKAKPSQSDKAVKTQDAKFENVKLKFPETWELQPNTSKLNKLEFKIPPVEGDSEPADFYMSFFFGTRETTEQTVNRWIDSIQPDGRKSKVTQGTCPQGKYVIVDVSGTFKKRDEAAAEPTQPLKNARMLAVELTTTEDSRYFLILSGPSKTVTSAAKDFRASFGGDEKKEKQFKLEPASK